MHALQTAQVAADAAEAVGAEVVVLHVCDPQGAPWAHYDPDGFGQELDTPATADSLVDRMAGVFTARGLTALPTAQDSLKSGDRNGGYQRDDRTDGKPPLHRHCGRQRGTAHHDGQRAAGRS
jgi:hypothetical protein